MIKLSSRELYGMFLESQWWLDLSFTKRCEVRRCERCGCTYGLQCHHKRYPENWFDTKLSDLEVLCRECHEKEHGIKPRMKKWQGVLKWYRKKDRRERREKWLKSQGGRGVDESGVLMICLNEVFRGLLMGWLGTGKMTSERVMNGET